MNPHLKTYSPQGIVQETRKTKPHRKLDLASFTLGSLLSCIAFSSAFLLGLFF